MIERCRSALFRRNVIEGVFGSDLNRLSSASRSVQSGPPSRSRSNGKGLVRKLLPLEPRNRPRSPRFRNRRRPRRFSPVSVYPSRRASAIRVVESALSEKRAHSQKVRQTNTRTAKEHRQAPFPAQHSAEKTGRFRGKVKSSRSSFSPMVLAGLKPSQFLSNGRM